MVLIGLLLIITFVCTYAALSLNAQSLKISDTEIYTNEMEEDIKLYGSMMTNSFRSPGTLVNVTCNTLFINVVFLDNLSHVSIKITNEFGTPVYQMSVNTEEDEQALICIAQYEAGKYTIHFTNTNGGYLSGNFNKN